MTLTKYDYSIGREGVMQPGMNEIIVTDNGAEFWRDGQRVANQHEEGMGYGQFLWACLFDVYASDTVVLDDPRAGMERVA